MSLHPVPDGDPALRHPVTRSHAVDQDWLDQTWEYLSALHSVWQVLYPKGLPNKRDCVGISVFPSDRNTGFTASIKAEDRGKSNKRWVIYSNGESPFEALLAAVDYAKKDDAAWKELPPMQSSGAARGTGRSFDLNQLMP